MLVWFYNNRSSPLNSRNVLLVVALHCWGNVPCSSGTHSSEIPESAVVSHQDLGLEGEFLLERAAEKVLPVSHLTKLLCVSVIEMSHSQWDKMSAGANRVLHSGRKKWDVWAGCLSCTEMWGWQCLCGLGIPALWLAGCLFYRMCYKQEWWMALLAWHSNSSHRQKLGDAGLWRRNSRRKSNINLS